MRRNLRDYFADGSFLRVRSSASIANEGNFYLNYTLWTRRALPFWEFDCSKSRIGAHDQRIKDDGHNFSNHRLERRSDSSEKWNKRIQRWRKRRRGEPADCA